MNLFARIMTLIFVQSPIYPHWLDFRNLYRANALLYAEMKGDVLETGCGNAEVKREVLERYPTRIKSYLATDYSSWDEIFSVQTEKMSRFGFLTRLLYGKKKEAERVDRVCDALKLPFPDATFDTYASFETLEHIDYPEQFFAEASRVLRKGGKMLVSVPFIYREHSEGTAVDYHRFTGSCLKKLAKDHSMKATRVFTYSYFGTAMAAFVNQYVVRKIAEGNLIAKVIIFIGAPFIFILTNCLGFLIDSVDHDERFASHYHLIAVKQ